MTPNYQQFLLAKSQIGSNSGFNPSWMPDFLFDFQKSLLDWSITKGKAGIFADCGLGKTPMQLVWAQNVVQETNKPVLIIAPLAVSAQTCRDAEKFGVDCKKSSDGKPCKSDVTITNYEQLHKFNPDDFSGAAGDESSILKSFKGTRKQEITTFMRKLHYRSLWTATAAPNDCLELGTSSEALGYMGHMAMLGKFFKNDQNTSALGGRDKGRFNDGAKWRFKGHAELAFWKWVCSWARAIRKPSDLGFSDDKFILPPLVEQQHIVNCTALGDGMLFSVPAQGLKEQRDERRRSIQERCEKMTELANTKEPALLWCHLNDEGDLLKEMIPDAIQVAGSDSDEVKEERFLAFQSGQARALITKPKIGAWGLNFQHCNHVLFFPSHSFEQYYQGVRRCWRFGQKRAVHVDVVASEGELNVLKNLQRKSTQADKMFSELVKEMNNAVGISSLYNPKLKEQVPSWLNHK